MSGEAAVRKAREVMAYARVVIRKARAADHRCVECGNRASEGRKRCKRHLKADAKRSAARKAERVDKGLCYKCGKTKTSDFKECSGCRAMERIRQLRKDAA